MKRLVAILIGLLMIIALASCTFQNEYTDNVAQEGDWTLTYIDTENATLERSVETNDAIYTLILTGDISSIEAVRDGAVSIYLEEGEENPTRAYFSNVKEPVRVNADELRIDFELRAEPKDKFSYYLSQYYSLYWYFSGYYNIYGASAPAYGDIDLYLYGGNSSYTQYVLDYSVLGGTAIDEVSTHSYYYHLLRYYAYTSSYFYGQWIAWNWG